MPWNGPVTPTSQAPAPGAPASDAPSYLLRPQRTPTHRFAYIGVPHDAATSLGNPGARFGPQALREALQGIFEWRLEDGKLADIDRGIVDLSAVEVVDLGDLALSYHDTETTVEETYRAVKASLEAGVVPLIAGGDHSVTYPCFKALHDSCRGAVGLIQLDAHLDLLDASARQGRFSGSSGMRRSLELERLDSSHLVQVGLRGYSSPLQYEMQKKSGIRRITARQLAEMGIQAAAEQALAWAGAGTEALYLTIDMDVVDPGEAPGTGWPEPGGITGQQLLDFVRIIAPHAAAIDVAELNPVYDTRARTTTLLAARLLLDCIVARL